VETSKKKFEYLSPKMVEERYHVRVGTLANWRCQSRGPEYVKLGRKIMYPVQALEVWCQNCRVLTADSVSLIAKVKI